VQTRGYVPAGGASSRFGNDQSLAEIGGLTVLARMSEPIESEAGCVKHCGNGRPMSWLARAATVADRWPGEGPWGGIITALDAAEGIDRGREWNVIVSCNMPFLTREWPSRSCSERSQVTRK
jgi:molybdopterin-guanine dinucleotide biosynthesis protein A